MSRPLDTLSRAPGSTVWLLLALAAITLAVYAPVRHFDFVSIDDPLYVSENPAVAGGLSRAGVAWAFTAGHAANWHPLTWLSHMADVQLFGMAPGWHHVTNVVLHVLNTLLLFLLLARMTGRTGASAFVAALFAVHPLHVESVAWIAERKDVLSTLWLFLTLWAYLSYVGIPARGRGAEPAAGPARGTRRLSYALMLACYALGLMAKPMLVTLPFVLLLIDWWPLGRARTASAGAGPPPAAAAGPVGRRALVWEKAPLFALAAAASLVTFAAQQRGGAVSNLAHIPFGHRAANAIVACGAYAMKALWPSGLIVFYRYPPSVPIVPLAVSAAFLAGVTWLALRAARSRPYVIAGWLWYLITLAPVVGIVQVGRQAMADRYTYVPLIGLFVIVTWGARDLLVRWPARRIVLPIAAAALVIGYAFTARAQVGHWADSTALWKHALAVDPGNYYAHNSLGTIASDAGETTEAIGHFSRAVRFAPDYPEAHNNLGLMHAREGRAAEAVTEYRKALALNPGLAAAHDNLGVAFVMLGKGDEAIAEYETAIRLDPAAALFRSNLGAALYGQGRAADAIAPFNEALRLNPALAPAHTGLALALTALGRLNDAIPHFIEAVRLQPASDAAHQYLGIALAGAGRFDEAIVQLNEALRINPGNETAKRALDMAASRAQAAPKAGR
jgi:tetratricopeptide (TPR) repeat protein